MKNSEKNPLSLRLQRLRAATGKTWDALAKDLGVQRAMIFHVAAGRRGFSEETLERLVAVEVAAGVRTAASALIERGLRGEELIEALIDRDEASHSKVTVEDIDTGSKEILLEYRRGSPPQGYPKSVRIIAPRNATVWMIIGEDNTRKDPSRFLAACLPDLQEKTDALERLTPSCYALILDTALDLTFGLNWRAKLSSNSERKGPT